MEAQSNQLQKFYKEVFEEFKDRLFLAYRFRSSIKSQQLDKFAQKVQKKLEKSKRKELFQLGLKLALQKKSDKIEPENQVKIQQEQRDYLQNNNNLTQSQSKEDKNKNKKQQSESSEEEDDLMKFRTQKENKDHKNLKTVEVKVQEKEEEDLIREGERNEEEIEEEEYRKREQILSKRETIISTHIIGTYSTRTKKYIPKDQRTKIQLQNVFIRSHDKEAYFTKVLCQFTQTQYSNIKF